MLDKQSKVWAHYQKLQESLSELMEPGFETNARSFILITLNQTYTHTERLFELVEETTTLSKTRQATLAKLAHHIETTKERGLQSEFTRFIQADLSFSLAIISDLYKTDTLVS